MRLHHDAKIERLKQIPLFRNATKEALVHLAQAADEIDVSAGTQIIVQGHHNREASIIVSGAVEVKVDGELVAKIPAGEIVGELGLFGLGPATATVTATEDTTLISIPYNRFDQILEDNPPLVIELARELAGRLFRMDVHHASHTHE
ncbi:MAG: cyclic nucleotide-binding domain-containing protein [Acidimicrobiia bacterium]|nr:cyclic nucleotide-binding domain-containing protein [Acidimicrobiia bacterium]